MPTSSLVIAPRLRPLAARPKLLRRCALFATGRGSNEVADSRHDVNLETARVRPEWPQTEQRIEVRNQDWVLARVAAREYEDEREVERLREENAEAHASLPEPRGRTSPHVIGRYLDHTRLGGAGSMTPAGGSHQTDEGAPKTVGANSLEGPITPTTGNIMTRGEWRGVPPMRGTPPREPPPVIEGKAEPVEVTAPKPPNALPYDPVVNGLRDAPRKTDAELRAQMDAANAKPIPPSVMRTNPGNEPWRDYVSPTGEISMRPRGNRWGPI
jgi:hypothetical protein